MTTPLLALQSAQMTLPGHTFGPFDLQLAAGERIAILGCSGAGKSTLLRLMAGEHRASGGEVHIDGLPLLRWARPALARRRAVLPQSHAVAFGMPVALVVSLGRIAHEPDPMRARIVAGALDAAQAAHLAGRRFDTLSGGEQARVQMARVFAQLWDVQSGLLLVDEPLAALDPGLQFRLIDVLSRFAAERNHALVAVLHDINQALAHFQRLWLMREGRIVGDLPSGRGAVAAIEALYGITLRRIEAADGSLAVLPCRPTARSWAREAA
jgi:iron complex transport system ATP-binding protein